MNEIAPALSFKKYGKTYYCRDHAEASATFMRLDAEHQKARAYAGPSKGVALSDGTRIAPNGTVWASEWTPGAEPIYDPRPAPSWEISLAARTVA